eukprot:10127629-Alexandrium_andersonii.AAC.1
MQLLIAMLKHTPNIQADWATLAPGWPQSDSVRAAIDHFLEQYNPIFWHADVLKRAQAQAADVHRQCPGIGREYQASASGGKKLKELDTA